VWDAPNYINWGSARWTPYSAAGATAREAGGECRLPDVLGYTDSEGNQHTVKVPVERFDEALSAIEAEDYAVLKEFEHVDIATAD
jgi:hypothetical protein